MILDAAVRLSSDVSVCPRLPVILAWWLQRTPDRLRTPGLSLVTRPSQFEDGAQHRPGPGQTQSDVTTFWSVILWQVLGKWKAGGERFSQIRQRRVKTHKTRSWAKRVYGFEIASLASSSCTFVWMAESEVLGRSELVIMQQKGIQIIALTRDLRETCTLLLYSDVKNNLFVIMYLHKYIVISFREIDVDKED